MKKTFMLAFVMAFTLVLSACGKDDAGSLEDRINEAAGSEETILTYQGTLEKIDLSIHQQGTHQIDTGSQVMLIQSARFNLDNYLGKKVEVSGTSAPTLGGNAKPVLNVNEINLLEEDFSQLTSYESENNYFSLKYPENWDLERESSQLNFTFNGRQIGSLTIFDNVQDLTTFAENREGGTGINVTIAHQASLRYNDTDSFRVYIPHKPLEKVFLMSFGQENFQESERRNAIYALIKSVELIYDSTATEGETCGGPENIACPADYFCKLDEMITPPPLEEPPLIEEEPQEQEVGTESEEGEVGEGEVVDQQPEPEEVALIPFGVCVPKNAGSCPVISVPRCDGAEAYVNEYSEAGCPKAFACPSSGQSSLELTQQELVESLSGLTQEESDEDEEGDQDAEEDSDVESTDEEDNEDDGDEEQIGESEGGDYNIPSVSSVTETVEISQKSFSFKRPSSWWYSGLPNSEGTQWLIGLADGPLWEEANEEEGIEEGNPELEKAIITISVIDKDEDGLSAGYTATKSRDSDTEYRVQGPKDLKAVIDAIADSIEEL